MGLTAQRPAPTWIAIRLLRLFFCQRRSLAIRYLSMSLHSWPLIQGKLVLNLSFKRGICTNCKFNQISRPPDNTSLLPDVKTTDRRYVFLIKSFQNYPMVIQDIPPKIPIPITHKISTIHQPFYPPTTNCQFRIEKKFKCKVKKLEKLGIIRESKSDWYNSCRYDTTLDKLIGNYYVLNTMTKHDPFQLPNIEEILDACRGSSVFSVLHSNILYRIPICKVDIKKTAIYTPLGLFEFLRLPSELRNSHKTVQKFMNYILKDLSFVRVYIDKLLVFSKSHSGHFRHLSELLEILQNASVPIDWNKSIFGHSHVDFNDYSINKDSIEFKNIEYSKEILNFEPPTDIKTLNHFLYLAHCYISQIPEYSRHQKIIQTMKTDIQNETMDWSKENLDAFNSMKLFFLQSFDFTIKKRSIFSFRTKISENILATYLSQRDPEGIWTQFGFFSRPLIDCETNYNQVEKKMLAIFEGLKKFEAILVGKEFVILTSNRVIGNILQAPPTRSNFKFCSMMNFISQFNYEVVYSTDFKHS